MESRDDTFPAQDVSQLTIDDLLDYLQRETFSSTFPESQTASAVTEYNMECQGFESSIKFGGRPILPPILTHCHREEMQLYRQQAVMAEARLKTHARQKLLARIQTVLNSIPVSRTQYDDLEKSIEEQTLMFESNMTSNVSTLSNEQIIAFIKEEQGHILAENAIKDDTLPDSAIGNSPRSVLTSQIGTESCQQLRESDHLQDKVGTMDSGFSCKTIQELPSDEPLDTMAEITDISSEEHNDADDEDEQLSENNSVEFVKEPEDCKLSPAMVVPEKLDESGSPTFKEKENNDTSPVLEPKHKSPLLSVSPKMDNKEPSLSVTLKQRSTIIPNSTRAPLVLESDSVETKDSSDTAVMVTAGANYSQMDHSVGSRAEVQFQNMVENSGMDYSVCGAGEDMTKTKVSASNASDHTCSTESTEELSVTVMAKIAVQEEDKQLVQQKDSIHTYEDENKFETNLQTGCNSSLSASCVGAISEILNNSQLPDASLNRELDVVTPLLNRAAVLLDHDHDESPEKVPALSYVDTQETCMDKTELNEIGTLHENGGVKIPSEVVDDAENFEDNSILGDYHDLPTPGRSASPSVSDVPCLEEIEGPKEDIETYECETQTEKGIIEDNNFEVETDNSVKCGTVKESVEKSEDISTLQTASTDLAPYMVTSNDTIHSSLTTLPNLTGTYVPSASSKELIENIGTGVDPVPCENVFISKDANEKRKSSSHVRRNSYTLEAPSPALLKAVQKDPSNTQGTEIESSENTCTSSPIVLAPGSRGAIPSVPNSAQSKRSEFQMTSSMEDLKLKPVQRKLHYEEVQAPNFQNMPSGNSTLNKNPNDSLKYKPAGLIGSERDGKEEHLHRYLEHISQMPVTRQNMQNEHEESLATADYGKMLDCSNVTKEETTLHHTQNVATVLFKTDTSTIPGDLPNDKSARPQVLHEPEDNSANQNVTEVADYLAVKCQPTSALGTNKHNVHNKLHEQAVPEGENNIISCPVLPITQSPRLADTNGNTNLLTEEDLLLSQMEYFEKLRVQLVNQQQQQLALLLAEQQRQQLFLQQEMMEHSRAFSAASSHTVHPSSEYRTGNVLSTQTLFNSRHASPQLPELDHSYDVQSSHIDFSSSASRKQPLKYGGSSNSPHAIERNHVQQNTHVSPQSAGGVYIAPSPIHSRCPNTSLSEEICKRGHQRHSEGGNIYMQHAMDSAGNTSTPSPHSALHHRSQLSGKRSVTWSLPEHHEFPVEWQLCFNKVSAAAKGYLTRRLLRTERVQQLIKTISDTADFAIHFQQESPIRNGIYNSQDKNLQDRVINQLTAAMYEIHEVFFDISIGDRMYLIRQSRSLEKERHFKAKKKQADSRRLSAATLKAMERRKKAQQAEAAMMANVQMRPKSAPPSTSSPRQACKTDLSGPIKRNYQFLMNRALKPIQAQFSPMKPVKDTQNRALHVATEKDKDKKTKAENNPPEHQDSHLPTTTQAKRCQPKPKPSKVPKRKTAVVRPSAVNSTKPNPWK